MSRPLPTALKALQRQLGAVRDDATRNRLLGAIAYVRALYGLPGGPMIQENGDMKRRRLFTRQRHRLYPQSTLFPNAKPEGGVDAD